MPQLPKNIPQAQLKEKAQHAQPDSLRQASFLGFQPPTSNTLYCPNQFFDVCIPHRSRGCARLVGYVLRRTLGWSDEHGNPLEEQVVISYSDLTEHAGISRDMIRSAIDEALEYGFIVCIRKGQAKSTGKAAINALYELRWDERPEL